MKYLEGNIFVNFYIFGAAGIAAVFLGGIFYSRLGLKLNFIVSFAMAIFGEIGMLIIQSKIIKFDSDELRDQFDERFMPFLILILKMGIIMGFITTT